MAPAPPSDAGGDDGTTATTTVAVAVRDRHPWPLTLSLAVAVLAVLAGCGLAPAPAGGDGDGAAPAATPAPVPDAPTTTARAPSTTRIRLPSPVVSVEDGLPPPAVLAAAHRRRLANASYTVARRITARRPDGGLEGQVRLTGQFGAGRARYNYTRVVVSPPVSTTRFRYATGDAVYTRDRQVGTRPSTALRFDPTGAAIVRRVFAALEPHVTGVTEASADVFQVRASGSGPAPLRRFAPAADVRDVRLRARVTRTGVVRRLRLSYVTDTDRPLRILVVMTVTDVGTTQIVRPDWVPAGVGNATTTTPE